MKHLFPLKILLFTAFCSANAFLLSAASPKNGPSTTEAAFQVSGKVVDNTGDGLIGASVIEKGTTNGAIADADGNFTLSVADGNAILVVSYTGYDKKEVPVNNQALLSITLSEGAALSEVIVVGYGSQRKSQTTGAISSISNKQISELPVMNARQALQGRAAGVDVVQSGSKPGAAPQIRIRGRRSFNASNDPLYVVDGIPLAGDIDDINPQDIQSMEVLKDASSTAIYGARGANGVVLVTTQRGKAGKTTISINTYIGPNQSLGKIEVMNGAEFAEFKRESRRTTGNYPAGPATPEADAKLFEAVELESIKLGRSTDYVDLMTRNGLLQSHQIGVSGGNEKTTFYISGNFFKDKGIVINQDFTRNTFRINLDHKINDRIKIGTSTFAVYSTRNGENFNPIGGAMQENPLGKPYDDEGNLIFLPTSDGLRTNPIAEIVPGANVDETKRYRIFNSLFGEWNLFDGLTYRVNFGPDISIRRTGNFVGSQTNARRGGAPVGGVFNAFGFNYTLENIFTYSKTFRDKHAFSLTALQSVQQDNFELSTIGVLGIPAEFQSFYSLGNASQVTGVGTRLIEWAILSYMGRLNYSFDDRYLLTATLRRDGSSRFGENSKFGNFPSIALGWNISNESFLKNTKWLDQLKLRLSYGSIGNQAINPYQKQALLERTTYAWDNAAAFGYRPGTIGNPDLRWEASTSANAGLDFSVFNGRISGSLEYYVTTTTDLLAPQPLPTSIGFGGFTTNIGKTRNKGVELTLSTVNIVRNDFEWSTDWTFMSNRESILELANGKIDDVAALRFIGQPLSVFYDLEKVGIWQTSEADEAKRLNYAVGEIKIRDANGDGKIDVNDRTILGSAVPKWAGGLTNRFRFKGLDFNFFVFARVGQMIRSRFHDQQNLLFGRYNNLAVDYWTPENPTNDFPRPNQNQEFPRNNSSMTYFDGSFFKIRNINLGYEVPKSLAKRFRMESLRVYTSIQQPLIVAEYRSRYKGIDPETQIDPEQGVGGGEVNANVSPAVRSVTFGINAKF
jgi:TonB-linked SusC/RagA family outer membrane protein